MVGRTDTPSYRDAWSCLIKQGLTYTYRILTLFLNSGMIVADDGDGESVAGVGVGVVGDGSGERDDVVGVIDGVVDSVGVGVVGAELAAAISVRS